MPAFKVGSVPYVNAIPLVHGFEMWPDSSPVEVVYEVPSALPSMLDARHVDAILVSSIEALRKPGRTMAAGICIGSEGPVESVRLFSQVPFAEIRTLALDQSSMTSNALGMILLSDLYGAEPATEPAPPDLMGMLDAADACILIGDAGMTADASQLHVLDLGEAWTCLTGLPFVWAAWIGRTDLDPRLAFHLAMAARDILLADEATSALDPDTTQEVLALLQRGHAVANGCFVAAVNRVGTEEETEFWGQTFVANPYGEIVDKASVSREEVLVVPCDLQSVEDFRRIWPFFRDRRIDTYAPLTQRYLNE